MSVDKRDEYEWVWLKEICEKIYIECEKIYIESENNCEWKHLSLLNLNLWNKNNLWFLFLTNMQKFRVFKLMLNK